MYTHSCILQIISNAVGVGGIANRDATKVSNVTYMHTHILTYMHTHILPLAK